MVNLETYMAPEPRLPARTILARQADMISDDEAARREVDVIECLQQAVVARQPGQDHALGV